VTAFVVAEAVAAGPDKAVFAVVGGEEISWEHFHAVAQTMAKQRFFHGSVPEDKSDPFYKEVERTVIDRTLLSQEAKRRQYRPRDQLVTARITQVDERNRNVPGWEENRVTLLKHLRAELEENDLLEQLESEVTDIPRPEVSAIRGYYENHPEKFTTPAQTHLSLILLTVEPWAPRAKWQEATDLASRLVSQLRQGDDFAALAHKYSGHESAANGGDLGFVHKGMLSGDVQPVIDGMKPGDVSEPIRMLQGIAIFRLGETIPPVLNDFDKVRERAEQLLQKEREEQTWQSFIQKLRDGTMVKVFKEPAGSHGGKLETSR
jgi:parvulin-like peptidyl-prolyl isomerase